MTAWLMASAEETINHISKGKRRRNSAVLNNFIASISKSKNIRLVASGTQPKTEAVTAPNMAAATVRLLPVERLLLATLLSTTKKLRLRLLRF